MKLKRNRQDDESRQFWEFVDRTAEEVSSWPDWKKGGTTEPQAGHEPPHAVPEKKDGGDEEGSR